MANATTIAALLLSLCLLHFTHAESESPRRKDCILSLNILIAGALDNFYVYTCDCRIQEKGPQVPVARASVKIPPSIVNSAARSAAVVRCTRKAEPRLFPLCATSPRRFDRQAKKRLERCIHAKPNASERRRKGKFRFSTRRCTAVLATFFGAQTGGVWLCECTNNHFDVITGRAVFLTDDSPLGAAQELETVRACGVDMTDQMQEICENSPMDFSILGLQQLQVCCKRGRVSLPNEKFACAAIVPDDLSGLKDTTGFFFR